MHRHTVLERWKAGKDFSAPRQPELPWRGAVDGLTLFA
jgi:hypothetical protein